MKETVKTEWKFSHLPCKICKLPRWYSSSHTQFFMCIKSCTLRVWYISYCPSHRMIDRCVVLHPREWQLCVQGQLDMSFMPRVIFMGCGFHRCIMQKSFVTFISDFKDTCGFIESIVNETLLNFYYPCNLCLCICALKLLLSDKSFTCFNTLFPLPFFTNLCWTTWNNNLEL